MYSYVKLFLQVFLHDAPQARFQIFQQGLCSRGSPSRRPSSAGANVPDGVGEDVNNILFPGYHSQTTS